MKISEYTTFLVIICMLMGGVASGVVYFQAKNIDNQHILVNNQLNKKVETANIDGLTSQWLTILDLYLVNRHTYLYESLVNEGKNIENLSLKLNNSSLTKLSYKIKKVIEDMQGSIKLEDINNNEEAN